MEKDNQANPVAVITLDGPSGAGKGTISRLLAQKLGFDLLDSGALYRITALACIEHSIDLNEQEKVALHAHKLDIAFLVKHDKVKIELAGQDISAAIRTEEVGMAASKVAPYPQVRKALLQKQRDFAKPPGLVADGRDMGTTVFPNAPIKFYLTASAQERARRRVLQLQQSGVEFVDEKNVLRDIQLRDEKDQNRTESPLKPADDALVIDCTHLNIEQVFERVYMQSKKVMASPNVS